MGKVSALKVYEILRGKIGEEESRTLIEWVGESIESGAATKADIAVLQERMATKADIAALKDEIWKIKLALLGIAILIVVTNPKVVEILGKLLGIIP